MTGTPDGVRKLISLAGGSLPGKTRLHKTAYLLEAFGVGFGFDFRYHYYGPYSDDLALAAEDAMALGLLRGTMHRSTFGIPYVIYEIPPEFRQCDDLSDEGQTGATRRQLLEILRRYDTVSLELAATAHFLSTHGFSDRAWDETVRRKREKSTFERLESARRLLNELERFRS